MFVFLTKKIDIYINFGHIPVKIFPLPACFSNIIPYYNSKAILSLSP